MIATVALALAAIVTPAPAGPSHLAPCAGAYVIVYGEDEVPCDVNPPQRLDVLNIDRAECDYWGGTYDAPGKCIRVNY